MKSALFIVVVFVVSAVKCQRMTDVVQTDKGPVRGRIFETIWHSNSYSAFMGIPYAKPPLGPLRFRPPVESDPWTEVINATDNLNICIQQLLVGPIGSEDCLYLNVYSPLVDFKNIGTLKPVMVWIYGGAFFSGFPIPGVYGPDFFIEEDVVVVTFAYRLAILGYLALDIPGVEGNAGLLDQVLVFQWVKDNIAKFGGDPNRVTIFGESAGGASVGFHLLSPQSTGLFNQAILQSGTPLCSWAFRTRPGAIQHAFAAGRLLGYKGHSQQDLLRFLEQRDVAELISTSHLESSTFVTMPLSFEFVPTISSNFLDTCPIEKFRSGNFTRVPVLLGHNHDEAILFNTLIDDFRQIFETYLQAISNLGPKLVVSSIAQSFVDKMLNATTDNLIEAGTAFYFSIPADLTQRYIEMYNGDNPTYFYQLSYKSNYLTHYLYDSGTNGTSHADDLALLFNVNIIGPTDVLHPFNQYRKKVVSMWANFAKYGNPTPNNEPINGAVWEPSGPAGLQLNIKDTNTMEKRALSEKNLILEKQYDTLLPYISECKLSDLTPSKIF